MFSKGERKSAEESSDERLGGFDLNIYSFKMYNQNINTYMYIQISEKYFYTCCTKSKKKKKKN